MNPLFVQVAIIWVLAVPFLLGWILGRHSGRAQMLKVYTEYRDKESAVITEATQNAAKARTTLEEILETMKARR
jgi:hypothetical protein